MGWAYAIINCCMPLLLLSLLQISFQSYCFMVFFPLNLWTVCLCLFLNLVKVLLEFLQFFVTSDLQFGFKIIHQPLFVLHGVFKEVVAKYIYNGSPVFACFLDASKVFDLVSSIWVTQISWSLFSCCPPSYFSMLQSIYNKSLFEILQIHQPFYVAATLWLEPSSVTI